MIICMFSLENCVSLGRLSHNQCACAYIQQCHIAHFDHLGIQTLNSALENTRVRDTHEGTTVLMILRSARSGERSGTGAKLMHALYFTLHTFCFICVLRVELDGCVCIIKGGG